jgi:flavodoxin
MKKVLVLYATQTGNTKKLADAIVDAAAGQDVSLVPIADTDPAKAGEYDIVFVGSPIHAGGLSAQAGEYLQGLPEGADVKIAGFVTHSSSAFRPESFEKGLKTFDEVSKAKKIECLGVFDCQGKLTHEIRDFVKQNLGVSDEEFATMMAETDPHPDAADLKAVADFAAKILA